MDAFKEKRQLMKNRYEHKEPVRPCIHGCQLPYAHAVICKKCHRIIADFDPRKMAKRSIDLSKHLKFFIGKVDGKKYRQEIEKAERLMKEI